MRTLDVEISTGDVRPVELPAPIVSGLAVAGDCRLVGWSVRETSGAAPAALRITSSGRLVASIGLIAGASDAHSFGHPGIFIRADLSVTLVGGAMEGVLYVVYDKP